jgi:hypothetical protein
MSERFALNVPSGGTKGNLDKHEAWLAHFDSTHAGERAVEIFLVDDAPLTGVTFVGAVSKEGGGGEGKRGGGGGGGDGLDDLPAPPMMLRMQSAPMARSTLDQASSFAPPRAAALSRQASTLDEGDGVDGPTATWTLAGPVQPRKRADGVYVATVYLPGVPSGQQWNGGAPLGGSPFVGRGVLSFVTERSQPGGESKQGGGGGLAATMKVTVNTNIPSSMLVVVLSRGGDLVGLYKGILPLRK